MKDKNDYIRIDIDSKHALYITKQNKVSRYVVYYGVCCNEFGKRFRKLTKLITYDSMEELEADIGGLLLYTEYDDEIKEAQYDTKQDISR